MHAHAPPGSASGWCAELLCSPECSVTQEPALTACQLHAHPRGLSKSAMGHVLDRSDTGLGHSLSPCTVHI